jgi:hypothetical protein
VPGRGGGGSWLAAFLVTLIGCSVLIMQSLKSGSLALPPVYDDSSYYSDAARRLLTFYMSGLRGLLSYTVAAPPHGPLSTALAFSGFALFGMHPWAAVAANAILVFFFVRLFYWAAAELPTGQATLLAIALLSAPFFSVTVLECRPDMFCSLFVATGSMAVITKRWTSERRTQVFAGLAFAAALWAKPTIFPLTIALFFAAMFFASLPDFYRGNWRRPLVAGLFTLAVALILAAPYYIIAWRHVVDYIWTTAFGSEAAIWVQPLPFVESALYYLTGPTGKESLGTWLWLGGSIGLAALVAIWIHRCRTMTVKAVQVLAMVVIAYLAVTIPTFKGPHGLPFAALFLVAVAVAGVVVASALPRPAAWVFCGLVAIVSVFQFQWPTARPYGSKDPTYAATRWDMVHQAYAAMDHDAVGKTILLTTSAVFLNPTILELEYFRHGLMPPRNIEIQRRADVDELHDYISRVDMVFAVSPEFKEIFPNLPTSTPEFRAKVIQAAEESHFFLPATRVPDPIGGGAILIYQRPPDQLEAFASTENLRQAEGPYPKWDLPRVRWGTGAASRIWATGRPGAKAELMVRARTVPVPAQTLSIFVNGEEKLSPTRMTYEFQGYVIPFSYDPQGRADIELRYGTPASEAVLYRALSIRN